MNTLNYMFFEEFKKLDKVCKEIYNSDVGVTNYIKDMQSVPRNKYLFIKNFELNLKYLIRFRHIRNHLAHSEGGFDEKVCTEEDIVLIKNFHKRILTCSDPIALVLKNEKYQKNILPITLLNIPI